MRDVAPDEPQLPRSVCSPAAAAARYQPDLPTHLTSLLDVLETELGQLVGSVGADAAGVHLVEDDVAPPLRLCAQQGLSTQEERQAALAPLEGSLVGHCVCSRTSVTRCADDADEPAAAVWESSHHVFAAEPLRADDVVLGALWCFSRQGRLAPGADVVLGLVAHHIAELVLRHFLLQQVTTERREYEQLADHLRDTIWTLELEPEQRTVLVSGGVVGLTGYTPQDFADRPELWGEIIYPDDRPQALTEWRRAIADGDSELHQRVRIVRQDGEIRWAHTRGHIVREGDALRFYGLTTDVTDHVRLEEKVRRADRLSAVGMLAGGIAHEYNNLHFAILGTLDLLLMRDDLDAGTRQHINRVREAAERASEITTKLVAFARGGSGGREDLDVSELVDSALTLVEREFSTMGIQVEIMQSPLPLRVHGNRAELGQALINLVINAQQAMHDRPTKRLTIATGLDDDGRIFISVADTGHGVAPENLPRLFDPFFTTKGAAGSWLEGRAAADAFLPGRGLGLSVAQTIVHEHGGDIEVESEVGCGTKFTVYLPAPGLSETLPVADKPFRRPESGRILIADDEEPVREVCRELLERLGYEVAEAAGGAEALQLLIGSPFDLVLVDLQMPDMEGLELIRRINAIPADRRPAKLIITGNIDEVPPETCADLGISGLLQKRANLSELVSKVQLALAARQP
ncbi:response regulator [bacterium]|nr:response regulator [bacterium]